MKINEINYSNYALTLFDPEIFYYLTFELLFDISSLEGSMSFADFLPKFN